MVVVLAIAVAAVVGGVGVGVTGVVRVAGFAVVLL